MNMFAISHLTNPTSEFTRLILVISKFYLPHLYIKGNNLMRFIPLCRVTSGELKQACHNFFVKKPKIFENVKSERAAANFQKSRTPRASTIISKNSQI